MGKEFYIHIPVPCHENWNAMTTTSQGAFCKSCCKNVIDFSNKTENEIYRILSNGESMCGRFRSEQLQHPVRETEMKNGFFNWKAVAASLLAFFSSAKVVSAFDTATKPRTDSVAVKGPEVVIAAQRTPYLSHDVTGNLSIVEVQRDLKQFKKERWNICGKVIDENGEGIPVAAVYIKNTKLGTTTDFDGNFSLDLNKGDIRETDTLVISYIGYSTKEISLKQFLQGNSINLETIIVEPIKLEVTLSYHIMGIMIVEKPVISPRKKRFKK